MICALPESASSLSDKIITAGADFGAQLAPHGPKADLVSPTTVGECISQEPALVPSWDAVTGSTMEYTDR